VTVFDVGIRQSYADGEPVESLARQRHVGKRALACATTITWPAKFLGNCFGDLAHKDRAIQLKFRVLLNLIKDEDCEGMRPLRPARLKSLARLPEKLPVVMSVVSGAN